MNARLRELMLEAGYAAPELAGRAQKLAELIVKECTGFLKDGLDDHFAAEQLEEHFGVEQ